MQKLKENSIGLFSSIIMGVACSAPAYSLETASTTLIVALGIYSPLVLIIAGVSMLFLTFAFKHLNNIKPNAGGCYIWVGDAFGKTLGFLSGWALLFYCAIFMVSATVPVSNSLLILFAKDYVNNVNVIAIISFVLLSLISLVVIKGIHTSVKVQNTMMFIEVIILSIIAFLGFKYFGSNPVQAFDSTWFSISSITPSMIFQGIALSIFFYAGWDIAVNLSEETKNKNDTPGRATHYSVIILMFIFVIFSILTIMGLTTNEMETYNTNVIYALAEKVSGDQFASLAIIAVVLSTIGTIETSIIQFSRVLFAKSRDKMVPSIFSKIHEKWATPHFAIFVIWLLGSLFILLSSYVKSINDLLAILVSCVAFQFSFYAVLTAFACVYHFRNEYKITRSLVEKIILPSVGGIVVLSSMIYSSMSNDFITNLIGIGGIVIGLIPYYFYKRKLDTR